jgi:putative glycosyltransferase (TIGR04372 family)
MHPGAKKISNSHWLEFTDTPGLKLFYTPSFEKYKILKQNLEISKAQIACVHVRDSDFKRAEIVKNANLLNVAPDYDAIRSREFRNSEIENFLPSASLLNSYGIEFIRVGKVMKEISKINQFKFIDYSASEFQTEENDLLLITNSKFFIGTLSGLGEVARWARVPVFQIDVGEFTYFSSTFTGCVKSVPIILPKVITSRKTSEILSINQLKELRILELNIRDFHDYINSPSCPIFMSNNSSEVIVKTIELGINYLDKETEGNSNSGGGNFRLGQKIFSNLYNLPDNGKYPAISPWWPNALISRP